MMGIGKDQSSVKTLSTMVFRIESIAIEVVKNCLKYFRPAQGLPMMPFFGR